MNTNTRKLSAVSTLHYLKLIGRSALFLAAAASYIANRIDPDINIMHEVFLDTRFISFIWIIFIIEMALRFFPSKLESPGCQKQFACNYIKTGETDVQYADNNATVLVLLLWITMNAVIGALNINGILDDDIMLLLCLFYSVCDMICILFFCPFQSWFLKNKCCAACRIYNWDYAMMFTPLFFVNRWYSWSLLAMSVGLLLRWEITIFRHPERFSEKTNAYLSCSNCSEKLCRHKKQLQKLWVDIADFTKNRVESLK